MTVKKVGEIEVFEIDDDIQKMSDKERWNLVTQQFKDLYLGKEVLFEAGELKILSEINSQYTKKKFKSYVHHSGYETKGEYQTRLGIAAQGELIELLNNTEYSGIGNENKPEQGGIHKEGNKYYYFKKSIICNDIPFLLKVDIVEKDNRYIVYDIRIKELASLTKNSQSKSNSSTQIVSNKDKKHNIDNKFFQNEVQEATAKQEAERTAVDSKRISKEKEK